jgi:uncharacterized membrane protein YjgN (DUF898 family)
MTQQPPPYGGQGGPGYGYGYAPEPPKHPQAVTVLVLGILGIVVCGLCGPFAWSMGTKAEREMAAAPGRWSGSTEITIGKILGIVSTALLGLSVVVLVVFVFGGILAAGFSN